MKHTLDLDSPDSSFSPKEVFQGENGYVMLKLQQSYGGDSRFTLDNRFAGDLDPEKLPDDLKEKLVKPAVKDQEQEMMDKVLAQIVPSSLRKVKSTNSSVQINRFDPRSAINAEKIHTPELPVKRERTLHDPVEGKNTIQDDIDLKYEKKDKKKKQMKNKEKETSEVKGKRRREDSRHSVKEKSKESIKEERREKSNRKDDERGSEKKKNRRSTKEKKQEKNSKSEMYIEKIQYRKKAPMKKVNAEVFVDSSKFLKTSGTDFKLFSDK